MLASRVGCQADRRFDLNSQIYVPSWTLATVRVATNSRATQLETILDPKARNLFEILVRENSRMLLVYLRSLVQDETAVDDLFQETMVVAWRRLDECDLDRPFGPWLRGIASRLVMAHYRKQKVAPVVLQEAVLNVVDRHFESINLLAGDTWDDKVAALHACIAQLPERQKLVVTGRYFNGYSLGDLAESLETSLEACKKRLQRGRQMLAKCLKMKGVLSAAEAAS
ncbi:MAG: sigma-70 family RNA polymerase sigma factor [Planctomycetota bacterium]